jgi:hypothetical protein
MRKVIVAVLVLFLALCATVAVAHSGRTDSSGGHKDNNNVSGLGSYHYHHGYPAHLHTNGICPYDYADKTNSNTNASTVFGTSDDQNGQEEIFMVPWWLLFLCMAAVVVLVWQNVGLRKAREEAENLRKVRDVQIAELEAQRQAARDQSFMLLIEMRRRWQVLGMIASVLKVPPEKLRQQRAVYVYSSGGMYHARRNCAGVGPQKEMLLASARREGYKPCAKCMPDATSASAIHAPRDYVPKPDVCAKWIKAANEDGQTELSLYMELLSTGDKS